MCAFHVNRKQSLNFDGIRSDIISLFFFFFFFFGGGLLFQELCLVYRFGYTSIVFFRNLVLPHNYWYA